MFQTHLDSAVEIPHTVRSQRRLLAQLQIRYWNLGPIINNNDYDYDNDDDYDI